MSTIKEVTTYSPESMTLLAKYFTDLLSSYDELHVFPLEHGKNEELHYLMSDVSYEYHVVKMLAALSSDQKIWNPIFHSYLFAFFKMFHKKLRPLGESEAHEKDDQNAWVDRLKQWSKEAKERNISFIRFHRQITKTQEIFFRFRLVSQEIRAFLSMSSEPSDQELEVLLQGVFENISDFENVSFVAEIERMNSILQKIRYELLTRKKEKNRKKCLGINGTEQTQTSTIFRRNQEA